jgi:hypothetical protein
MTITTHWFVIAAAMVGLLATIAIWAPRSLKLKVSALICATLFLPLGYISLNDILSRPKPMSLESAHKQLEEVQIISATMKEDVGIFLWLQLPEVSEPRSYKLPWSTEVAKQLHKAQQDAEAKGTEVKMKKPFEKNIDNREAIFYAAPQPAPPPKVAPDEKPIMFNASAEDKQ